MIDALVAILAIITGTDDPGEIKHPTPECYVEAQTDCMWYGTDSAPQKFIVDDDGKVTLVFDV